MIEKVEQCVLSISKWNTCKTSNIKFFLIFITCIGISNLVQAQCLPAPVITCATGTPSVVFTEDFESGLGSFTGDPQWTLSMAGTPSFGTGPLAPQCGNGYVFAEQSNTTLPILTSSVIDLSNAVEANMTFAYHFVNASGSNTFDLEVSSDNGLTWSMLMEFNDGTPPSQTDGFVSTTVTLPIGNPIMVRFVGVENLGFNDFAIDDISIQTCEAPEVMPVPTMSEWGLMIYGLLVLNMGVVFLYRREGEVAVA